MNIPLGPDNFIEPREFDGMQPTHFDPRPSNEEGFMRYWGVFTIQVPQNFGDQQVVWTLRHRGRTWEIPGHIRSPHYILDEIESESERVSGRSAPVLKFDRDSPGVRGRNGAAIGPLDARVGVPLPLSVWVNPGPRPHSVVQWFHHQGPGKVTFSEQQHTVLGGGDAEVTTLATFSEPGDYIVRVTTLEELDTVQYHCCWTNGYVKVGVAR